MREQSDYHFRPDKHLPIAFASADGPDVIKSPDAGLGRICRMLQRRFLFSIKTIQTTTATGDDFASSMRSTASLLIPRRPRLHAGAGGGRKPVAGMVVYEAVTGPSRRRKPPRSC